MSWAQVTVLHMWMLIVRIRAFEPDRVKVWQQHFVDHFFYDAEGKMINTYKVCLKISLQSGLGHTHWHSLLLILGFS
jgi:hypothetical protein